MLNLDLFSLGALTQAINLFPLQYGRISAMGLFRDEFLPVRNFVVDEISGTLSLLPTTSWGGPPTVASKLTRKARPIAIPQTAHEDHLDPNDLQDVRAFGSDTAADMPAMSMARKLARMRARHDITAEFRKISCLKGIILDADGSTTLLNLFTEFGVSQVTVDFDLGTSSTDVRAKCMAVKRNIEDNLLGDMMSGVRAVVSQEFFDKLVAHPSVQDAYANYQLAAERLGGDMRSGFDFGGIIFEEYRAKATTPAGSVVRFIAANEGHAFPVGTMNTFTNNFAPADFMETVNTVALPFYAKSEMIKFERGLDLHTQSNNMPFCARPKVLTKLTSST